jgi:hypothetical protein
MSKQRVSYKNQELRKHHRHPSSSLFLRGVVPISWPEKVTFRLDDDDCFVLCLVFGGVFVAHLLSFLIFFRSRRLYSDTESDRTVT